MKPGLLVLPLAFAAMSTQALEFGGRLGVGSDYVYRGLRLTQSGPAVEALVDVRTESGWVAGAWANRIDLGLDGRDLETGYFAGLTGRVNPELALDTSIVRYSYHGQSPLDYDYWEWFGGVSIRERWHVTLGVARGWWAADEFTHLLELNYRRPLAFGVNAEVTLGYNNVSAVFGEDYGHYGVAVMKTFARFTGRVIVTGSSHHARRVLPDSIAPPARWIAELNWSF